MKHFMLPRNIHNELSSPNPNNTAKSNTPGSSKKPKRSSSYKENADPNTITPATLPATFKSPLPPRPPNSLKRKLYVESGTTAMDISSASKAAASPSIGSHDSGVKVIVRMRTPIDEKEEVIVHKSSNNTLTISGHTFTYDSIADQESTQIDLFQLVGAPLVENCLAGFNSSVFAYGQTGSGKTYTIWGPGNALSEENLESDQQGLTPRVFQKLFSRINEEQTKHSDRQLMYQCRCSFLEIYNEQITDLLDPTQKNLLIREDVKTGVYVENLTEEYVSTIKDVTHLLVKGLSNRKTGATRFNSESSRSHSVFTCVVESRCKSIEGGLSCLKKSRINLVDLAGSERQKLTGASGDRLKEAGNINRSLSQLGNLINILAEVSQTGKQRHIPYRDSKLTFLLQESLGGNAKLAMICAISPVQSCKSETFSTLRFAQRAKAIKNKAIVNEEMQEDVNVLREVIRQLKEELVRVKDNESGNKNGNQTGPPSRWNARKSLNLIKFSLNRPMILPHIDDDSDEEMEIVGPTEEESLAVVGPTTEDSTTPIQVTAGDDKSGTHQTDVSPILKSPTPTISPIIDKSSSKKSRKSVDETFSFAKVSSLSNSENLAKSLHKGLENIDNFRKSVALKRSSIRFPCKASEVKSIVPVNNKVDIGVQTVNLDNSREFLVCSKCKTVNYQDEVKDESENQDMQLVPVNEPEYCENYKNQVPKAVEKVLAGAIRREMALEEICERQNAEIKQLNCLVEQYKEERERNAIMTQTREDKIVHLESLIDGKIQYKDFMDDQMLSLAQEHKILKENYENNPEVSNMKLELKRTQEELEKYQNFFDLGEREVLLEELEVLRTQLLSYVDSSKKKHTPQLTMVPEITDLHLTMVQELRSELETEKKCNLELKEAMQVAIEGHATMLEQYAELEEKHIQLLIRHRKMQEGIEEVKKGGVKFRGTELKYVNGLVAENVKLKMECDEFREEIRGLKVQLNDSVEAVEAAGELLVRLRECEEAVLLAENRAKEAEQEIEKLKKKHEKEEEEELLQLGEPSSSWFSGYDRCNI